MISNHLLIFGFPAENISIRNGFNSNNMASLPALFVGDGGRVGLQEPDNYS